MKKANLILAALTLSAVAFSAGTYAYASAASEDTTTTTTTTQLQRHGRGAGEGMGGNFEAVQAVLEAGDYNAWIEAMGDNNPFADQITADNFSTFVAMHQAMQDGDSETADALRTELGLEAMGGGRGMGAGRDSEDATTRPQIDREAVQAALDASDYDAWVEAMGENNPLADKITADNFAEYVEMHQDMQPKNQARAQEIAQELGLDGAQAGFGGGKMMDGRGGRGGDCPCQNTTTESEE